MSNTKTVYRFDENGYYKGVCLAQIINDEILLPPDCTKTKPTLNDGYWSKWNGKKWENEKIPTTCAEAIESNLTCISNSPNAHDLEVKVILEALVASDSEHYKTVVSDNFVMTIEKIPEKILDELKSEKLSELTAITSKFDNQLVNTDMIIKSSLGFSINADLRSQNNLRGLISVGVEPVNFITADNNVKSLTLEQLNTLLNECALNGQSLYLQKWGYREQIEQAKTKKEIEAIELKFTMRDFTNE